MRFAVIICLFLSLLVPALGFKSQQQHPPRPHGDIVQFQGTNGPHGGIIVGSRPDRDGNYNIVPTAPQQHQRPGKIVFQGNRLVKAHASDIVRKPQYWSAQTAHIASSLARKQKYNPPMVSHATGAVQGSTRHTAAKALMDLRNSASPERG